MKDATALAGQLTEILSTVAREAADAAAERVLAQVRGVLAEAAAIAARPPIGPEPKEEMTTADVCSLFSIDKKTLYEWRTNPIDPDNPFPPPRRCSENTQRWIRSEVNAWRAKRLAIESSRRSRPRPRAVA